jgi:hypothetical protein
MPGLGRSVTIPRANGIVLVAGGSRSRFSLSFLCLRILRTGRYAVAPAAAFLDRSPRRTRSRVPPRRRVGAMLTLLRVHFPFWAFCIGLRPNSFWKWGLRPPGRQGHQGHQGHQGRGARRQNSRSIPRICQASQDSRRKQPAKPYSSYP